MKKNLLIFSIIFYFLGCINIEFAQAIELHDEPENYLEEIHIENQGSFAETIDATIEDNALIAPKTVKKTGIEVLNVNKPLLEDYLHFEFEKGPIEDMTFFGAYQGGITSNFYSDGYSTKYNNGFSDVGFIGKFRELPVDFKVMVNTRQIDGLTYMQGFFSDNYIGINAIPNHRIIIGNSRTPIGVEGGSGSYVLPLYQRSQISRNFGGIRALGVKVIGDYDLVEYNLGVYSSSRFFRSFFPGGEFTGWVNLKPLGKTDGKYGKLIVGGGLNAGRNDTNYVVGGGYVGYEYKKFSANFECAIADGSNGFDVSTKKSTGFYTTLMYNLTDKLQLVTRYDQFDSDRDISNNLSTEYTAGINYFIRGNALRLILNYVFKDNQASQDSHQVFFGTQLLL